MTETWTRRDYLIELYKRLPYSKEVLSEVVDELFNIMYELTEKKQVILLPRIGRLYPRPRKVASNFGEKFRGVVIHYHFMESRTLSNQMRKHKRSTP